MFTGYGTGDWIILILLVLFDLLCVLSVLGRADDDDKEK